MCTTPFGGPVVPEVKMMRLGLLGLIKASSSIMGVIVAAGFTGDPVSTGIIVIGLLSEAAYFWMSLARLLKEWAATRKVELHLLIMYEASSGRMAEAKLFNGQ